MASDPILVVISAPSGAGKSSLARALVATVDNAALSVSHTTRDIRHGEKDGRDYFFVSQEEFQRMIRANDLIEYAQVYSYYYGTSYRQIQDKLDLGLNVVLDIDWQGAQQVAEKGLQVIRVYLFPPSLNELKRRLLARGRDSSDVVKLRLAEAMADMQHYAEFDYLVLNDEFDSALADLIAILEGRYENLRDLPKDLFENLGIATSKRD